MASSASGEMSLCSRLRPKTPLVVHPDVDSDVMLCLQENDYLQECLEVVQQEFMIFNREK